MEVFVIFLLNYVFFFFLFFIPFSSIFLQIWRASLITDVVILVFIIFVLFSVTVLCWQQFLNILRLFSGKKFLKLNNLQSFYAVIWYLGTIPYFALRAQPPPRYTTLFWDLAGSSINLFLIFVYFLFIFCFYTYFRLGLPRRVRKKVKLGPRMVKAPAGARIRKKWKIKNKGEGGYLCSKSKTGYCPKDRTVLTLE